MRNTSQKSSFMTHAAMIAAIYVVLTVGIGEVISCEVLGLILYYALRKYRKVIF